MYFPNVRKFVLTAANLSVLWLMFKLVTGQLDWGLALGSVLISALWLGVTALSLRDLLTTYYDWMSRLRMRLPLVSGVVLAAVAIFANDSLVLRGIAAAELVAWVVVWIAWRRNKANFMRTGHGLLPAGTWINPPAAVLRPGDLVLTSGRMADRLDEAVGHGEVALPDPSGKMFLLTSLMLDGTKIREAEKLLRILVKKKEHFIVLRLKTPLTDEQIKRGWSIAQGMLGENVSWKEDWNARRIRFIAGLKLPASWKAWLTTKTAFTTTGYDWVGLFIGFKARNRWTCIGACAEWYDRLRVKIQRYGTGLLGLGTSLLDPIKPWRMVNDKNLHLLDENDRIEWERDHPPAPAVR